MFLANFLLFLIKICFWISRISNQLIKSFKMRYYKHLWDIQKWRYSLSTLFVNKAVIVKTSIGLGDIKICIFFILFCSFLFNSTIWMGIWMKNPNKKTFGTPLYVVSHPSLLAHILPEFHILKPKFLLWNVKFRRDIR